MDILGGVDDALDMNHNMTRERLAMAQNNIYDSMNDELYYSGNYKNTVTTTQGRIENMPSIKL